MASYTIKFELDVDVRLDTTKGRSITAVGEDIADFLMDNDEFWDAFPSVQGMSIVHKEDRLNANQ